MSKNKFQLILEKCYVEKVPVYYWSILLAYINNIILEYISIEASLYSHKKDIVSVHNFLIDLCNQSMSVIKLIISRTFSQSFML